MTGKGVAGQGVSGQAGELSLPERRYVPGRTPRHPEDAFAEARAFALPVTATATAGENGAWTYGLRLFNAGFWWEAHEVWEPVWMAAPPNGAERAMVQAAIQLANAALKRAMGRSRAAARLVAIARDLAAAAGDGAMGLTAEAFEAAVRAVEAGEAPALTGDLVRR